MESHLRLYSRVHLPAVHPDLSMGPDERLVISHSDHGCDEVCIEGIWVFGVRVNNGVCGSAIEELLVRVEEAFVAKQVLAVLVVKCCWDLLIEGSQVVISMANNSWAALLPLFGKESICVVLLKVNAVSKVGASSQADGVFSCFHNKYWTVIILKILPRNLEQLAFLFVLARLCKYDIYTTMLIIVWMGERECVWNLTMQQPYPEQGGPVHGSCR
ncbi:unnamed protein product [Victoria cruziana]